MVKWKRVPDREGNLEWFNPDSRLRISLKLTDISNSWQVFVYRRRLKPPVKGSAPTHHMFFNSLEKARKYIEHLLSVKNLDFNYLNSIHKREEVKKLAWMKDLIIDFFLNTAFFVQPNKNIDPLVFERNGITLKAELKEEGLLGGIKLHIVPISKHDLVRKHYKGQSTLLYFKHQNPFLQMTKDRAYYHGEIDKLVKRVYVTSIAMDALKDVLVDKKKESHRHSFDVNKNLYRRKRLGGK